MPISQARPHPERAKWRRSSLKATCGRKPWGAAGLPRDVGRQVRHPGSPVLGVEPLADRVAEVLHPLVRDLGEVPHALAVALGPRRGSACTGPPTRMGRPPIRRARRRSAGARVTEIPPGPRDPTPLHPLGRGCRRHSPHPSRPTRIPRASWPSGQQPAADQGQRLARQLPPVGEVLWGDGSPEVAAGDPAILHDARL